ncbi:MAG: tetratricopeptide repeat protein [Desulfuromonadaceae bacterium]|nr:tetratricopeptide repeat protein [Desulfuromonadaceae bacterium]MDD2854422.1 tetratricopeptide repeat protein [Desulfuromonadaceae bacterium]
MHTPRWQASEIRGDEITSTVAERQDWYKMKRALSSIVGLLLILTFSGCISGRGLNNKKPDPAAYHYQMGLSYLGERNYTAALIDLTEAEKYNPENPEVLYHLGLALMGKRRPDLAEAKFLKAIELKPPFSVARNDLGVAYLELTRWDSAISQFKIVKNDLFYENTESATINLGLAYLGKGDYPKALAELQSVASLNPRNPVVHVSMGRVYFAMDDNDRAAAEYEKALKIYGDYGAAHHYLGQVQLKQNKIEAARKSFKEAVRLIPESELGRAALGYLELIK